VLTLDRVLEDCEERAQWQKHYGDSQFFERLSSAEIKRLRKGLDLAVKGLEQELKELWSELNN
jgi:hypothetical protein